MSRIHRLMLAVAETDRTFDKRAVQGHEAWVGRCIHCRSSLTVSLRDDRAGNATLEHIVPKTHGGTDELENLALACARCNHGKGRRLDCLRRDDPTLVRVIETLRERRAERWRDRSNS